MTVADLRQKSQERLDDARSLLTANRFAAAVYIAGYAVEFALKARICELLGWSEYRTAGAHKAMKSHDLVFLLSYSGLESTMTSLPNQQNWSTVLQWNPELRYISSVVSQSDARSYLQAVEAVLQIIV